MAPPPLATRNNGIGMSRETRRMTPLLRLHTSLAKIPHSNRKSTFQIPTSSQPPPYNRRGSKKPCQIISEPKPNTTQNKASHRVYKRPVSGFRTSSGLKEDAEKGLI